MTQAFFYSEYLSDYIQKLLRDYADAPWMTEEVRNVLSGTATLEQNRDDDLEDYLAETTYVPSVGVSRVAVQSIPDGIFTAVSWDGQDWASTDVIQWDASPTPTRIYVQESGIVTMNCNVTWAVGTGTRQLILFSGTGSEITGATLDGAGGAVNDRLSVSGGFNVDAGDYFVALVLQVSGGALDVTGRMNVQYLGKAG